MSYDCERDLFRYYPTFALDAVFIAATSYLPATNLDPLIKYSSIHDGGSYFYSSIYLASKLIETPGHGLDSRC